MITEDTLARLESLEQAATPGPLMVKHAGSVDEIWSAERGLVATLSLYPHGSVVTGANSALFVEVALFVEARNHIRPLIAEVRRLRAQIEEQGLEVACLQGRERTAMEAARELVEPELIADIERLREENATLRWDLEDWRQEFGIAETENAETARLTAQNYGADQMARAIADTENSGVLGHPLAQAIKQQLRDLQTEYLESRRALIGVIPWHRGSEKCWCAERRSVKEHGHSEACLAARRAVGE